MKGWEEDNLLAVGLLSFNEYFFLIKSEILRATLIDHLKCVSSACARDYLSDFSVRNLLSKETFREYKMKDQQFTPVLTFNF